MRAVRRRLIIIRRNNRHLLTKRLDAQVVRGEVIALGIAVVGAVVVVVFHPVSRRRGVQRDHAWQVVLSVPLRPHVCKGFHSWLLVVVHDVTGVDHEVGLLFQYCFSSRVAKCAVFTLVALGFVRAIAAGELVVVQARGQDETDRSRGVFAGVGFERSGRFVEDCEIAVLFHDHRCNDVLLARD